MSEAEAPARDLPREPASRLLDGLARALAAKGYAETTIADIVREAGVSRRTFYEHFAGKAECLIALYEAASRKALRVLRDAIDPAQPLDAQIDKALAAYLEAMAANPELMRTLFIEILHLGTEGLAARRRVNEQIAGFVLVVANASPASRQRSVSPLLAMAVVGGINELVLTYIERGRIDALQELVAPAGELVRLTMLAQPAGPPPATLRANRLGSPHDEDHGQKPLPGTVSTLTRGAVDDEVELSLEGGQKLVAVVTHGSVDSLGLKVGTAAFALIKASSVIVATEVGAGELSARNRLSGTVAHVQPGAVHSEVVIDLAGGGAIVAIVTQESASALGLKPGATATAIFKASSVILGVD